MRKYANKNRPLGARKYDKKEVTLDRSSVDTDSQGSLLFTLDI